MTISISKSVHRVSASVETLCFKDYYVQQRLPSSDDSSSNNAPDKISSSASALVPERRSSGEQRVTTSSNDKRTRRRARSSLGGTEDFVKGLDFAPGAPQPEKNKSVPVSISKVQGLNVNGCVRASVQPSPTLAKRTTASPVMEKHGTGKSGAGSFQSSTLERSLSERESARIASRTLSDISTHLRSQPTVGAQHNLSNGSSKDAGVDGELQKVNQEDKIEPCTVNQRPSESPATALLEEKGAPYHRIQPSILQEHDDCPLGKEQEDAMTSCKPDSTFAGGNLKQGTWHANFIGEDSAKKELIVTMEKRSSFCIEASEMGMAKLSSVFHSEQRLNSNANATSSLNVVELPSVALEQSSTSVAHQDPTAVVDNLQHTIALETSCPEPQKQNELGANELVKESIHELSASFPTPSFVLGSDTPNVGDLLLEDVSGANGCQNIDMPTAPLEQQERESFIEPEENEGTYNSAAQDLLDLTSVPFNPCSGSFRTLDVHEQLSATTDKSSSSRWTSATLDSLSLPDADQELTVTGHGVKETNFSNNIVPFTAEKVTEEQLTEAAFLSNLGYSKDTIRCASPEEYLQHPRVSSAIRTNAFRSKSTGSHTAKVAFKEDTGLGGAHSDLEKEASKVSAIAANHLLLHPQRSSSRFNKVDLDRALPLQFLDVTLSGSFRCHVLSEKKLADNNTVTLSDAFRSPPEEAQVPVSNQQDADATVVKSVKLQKSQIPTLLDSSAFPRGVAMQSSLPSERLEGATLHKENADHLEGSLGQLLDLGCTAVINTASEQLKDGMESKAKLMDNFAECQQENADFMNPRFGMVHITTSNHISKLAHSMTNSTIDGMVTLTHEKSQNIREMVLVSPPLSLEDYHLGPSSISILSNPSFSSSQQDRLWEEQAEAYSSGGRGTPGREDNSGAAAFLTLRPAAPVPVDTLLPFSGSLRKGASDATVVPTSDACSERGKIHDGKKRRGKKKGQPRTPLRSLLAEETDDKDSGSHSRRSKSGANPCLKQLMSRIRGMTSKSSSTKSQQSRPHRSSFWSSCICFSPVK
ncbi:unnamed protein product [Sphagnum jensenii]|uniref:Uncharacterized protein n=1 Tax=Sphagnum jensenii TaxID=128206 RepID=A0ABP0VMA1_9BRYO